ncbi:ABC transporter substrate-binding protein [Actinomadura chibensis]|uniref:ABC transporter substrate-binding protein n=1 Tax=Actinomadura chibensis TaxID=392828 RepID=A0A5D0NLX0_9ACTN|nr:ABC transporter substrate-binding protein [Actinomadura chibensis]TYB45452.1 ABC transporter substrate-binding protein [Actinomadura chibensis]
MKTRFACISVVLAAALAGGCANAGTSTSKDGVRVDAGVTDDQIKIGLFNGYTGPVAAGAIAGAAGFDARLAKANAAGGVCGRKLTSVRADTKYDPAVAVQAYRANVKDIVMIGQLLGATSIYGLSQQIARDDIATLAATSAAEVIKLENVYLFTTPFPMYVINGLDWAKKEQAGSDGKLKVGVIYQDDAFGQEGRNAVRFVAKNDPDVKVVAEAGYDVKAEDFTAQVLKMKKAGAESVWIHGIASKTAPILSQASQLDFAPQWLTVDSGYETSLAPQLGRLLDKLHVVTSSVLYTENVPAMAEVKQNVEKVAPGTKPDQLVIAGWVDASVAVAALEKACKEKDLTQKGVVAAMSGLTVTTDGLSPDLKYGTGDADTRIPSRETRVNKIDLKSGVLAPVTGFGTTDLAARWRLADGAQG